MAFRQGAMALLCTLVLGACAQVPRPPAEVDVSHAIYVPSDTPRLTLITAINNRSGDGGHSGLMITTADERVLYDPAGTWYHRTVPEMRDVHFAMTPTMLDFYVDYHARETYHVVLQELEVDAATARRAMMLALERGEVSQATCSLNISGLLRDLGLPNMRVRLFPDLLMDDFARISGVQMRKVFDDSPDANQDLLDAYKKEKLDKVRADL